MFSLSSIKAVLYLVMPFLKELFLRDMTAKEALKTNKKKLYAIVIVILSILVNLLIIPNYLAVSKQYIDLKKEYVKCTALIDSTDTPIKRRNIETAKNLNKKENVSEKTPDVDKNTDVKKDTNVNEKTTKNNKNASDKQSERYSKVKDDFERMKKYEENAN